MIIKKEIPKENNILKNSFLNFYRLYFDKMNLSLTRLTMTIGYCSFVFTEDYTLFPI